MKNDTAVTITPQQHGYFLECEAQANAYRWMLHSHLVVAQEAALANDINIIKSSLDEKNLLTTRPSEYIEKMEAELVKVNGFKGEA